MLNPSSNNFYRHHLFVCTNQREDGAKRGCCQSKGGEILRAYAKRRAKELGLYETRINSAGCLDRCELGPVLVIYPEGAWYRADTPEDIDEILTEHLQNGRPVARLLLPARGEPQYLPQNHSKAESC